MKRNNVKQITIRLTADEYAHVKQLSKDSGLKMEPAIRRLIMGVNLRPRPPDELPELLRQLSGIGTNINQIAKVANASGYVRKEDIQSIMEMQAALWRAVKRGYRETLFFGLSVRQFVCSVLAVGVAVTLYFSLSRVLDRETVSWVCIVGAAPVAAAGFFQYNGLTLERFLWAWLKSEVIMAGKRVWKSENYYEEAMKREVKKH